MSGSRHATTSRDWFVRAAEIIGDLGSPFYREERQRDVWNEASAVGFQLMLWLSLVAATVAVWVVGAPALPYAQAGLGIVGVAALVTIAYAQRLGVTMRGADVSWSRLLPYVAVVGLLVAGMLRAQPERDGFSGGFATGAGVGSGIALAVIVVLALRDRRRSH